MVIGQDSRPDERTDAWVSDAHSSRPSAKRSLSRLPRFGNDAVDIRLGSAVEGRSLQARKPLLSLPVRCSDCRFGRVHIAYVTRRDSGVDFWVSGGQ